MFRTGLLASLMIFSVVDCFVCIAQAEEENQMPILVGQTGASSTFGRKKRMPIHWLSKIRMQEVG